MPRTIAFLRAINVGGHVVSMEKLRGLFESLGLGGVETFIASGNVIFDGGRAGGALRKKIEAHLEKSLGYEVATFLRTDAEVAAIAGVQPFPAAAFKAAKSLIVGFLDKPLTGAQEKRLMGFRSEVDDFRVRGAEIYWLATVGQGQSEFSNARMEKALGIRATLRGMNTVQRLAAKYPPARSRGPA
jgi:uncharacterized protein (DUF1697 family)